MSLASHTCYCLSIVDICQENQSSWFSCFSTLVVTLYVTTTNICKPRNDTITYHHQRSQNKFRVIQIPIQKPIIWRKLILVASHRHWSTLLKGLQKLLINCKQVWHEWIYNAIGTENTAPNKRETTTARRNSVCLADKGVRPEKWSGCENMCWVLIKSPTEVSSNRRVCRW